MADERTALVLGATGLVGSELLAGLLEDPDWSWVRVLTRRPTGRQHAKLTEVLAPLEAMDQHAALFTVHTVFCCLGTTLARAGSRQAFRGVDRDAVATAATLSARQGASAFVLVSAAGASSRSRIFYNRVKGEAEAAVVTCGVPGIAILRPSLLLGERAESRPLERIAQLAGRALAPLMAGPLRRVRPVAAAAVARAMRRLTAMPLDGVRFVENAEILSLGREAPRA